MDSDSPATLPLSHATHVAGTMIAEGVQQDAHGMASGAEIYAWESTNDVGEMGNASVASGIKLSNHSYEIFAGWYCKGGQLPSCSGGTLRWHGDRSVDSSEDYKFGFYSDIAADWDEFVHDDPYYLAITAAGNHRSDGPTSQPVTHEVQDNNGDWVSSTTVRDEDCELSGYDCVSGAAVAKNPLVVGALRDDGTTPADFSAFGPTDDGRIKPDIMANGDSVKSDSSGSNTAYDTFSGTSMAAPAVTGSIALLKDLLRPAEYHASTLKSLVLHTADDEIGPKDGPDYETGWGRMNTKRAAEVIEAELNASSKLHVVDQTTLDGGETLDFEVTTTSASEPLRATIAWTDPAPLSTPQPDVDPTTKMLLNDLNLRIIRNSNGDTYQPYKLNPSNLGSQTVLRGDNERDNVEQVYLANPAPDETYTLRVSHDGSLTGLSQDFGLTVTGNSSLRGPDGEEGDGTDGGDDLSSCVKVPSNITSDYTIKASRCAGKTVVKNGATLTIEKGITLGFGDTGKLRIASGAKLKVLGTSSSPVLLTGRYGDGWGNIVVRGDNSVIRHAEIRSSGQGCSSSCPALKIAANGVQITNANIHNNAYAGIEATETDPHQQSTFTLKNSTLKDNGGVGLRATWSTLTLNDNSIRNNGATGVSLEGYISVDIRSNNIVGNDEDGVYTSYNVTVDVFENNIVRDNASNGIDTQASQFYAAGDAWNQIYDNGSHEIVVRGNSPGVNFGDASAGEEGKNRIYHVTGDGLGYVYGPGNRYIKNNSSATVDAQGNIWHREGAYGGQEPELAMFSGDVNYGQPATEELIVTMNCLPGRSGKVVCTAYPYGGVGDFTYIWSFGQSSQDGKKCQVSCDRNYGGRSLTVTVVDDQGNYATATAPGHGACYSYGTSAYASLDQGALQSDIDSLSLSLQPKGGQNSSGAGTHGSRTQGNTAGTKAQSIRAERSFRTADAETLRRLYRMQRLNARVKQVRSGNRRVRSHPFEGRLGRRIHALLTHFAEADLEGQSHIRPEVRITACELLVEHQLRSGSPDKALQRAKNYLGDMGSNDRRARMNLMKARALGQQGNLDRALKAIDRAEELHPKGNEYASVRISVLRSNDDPRWKKIAERQDVAATNASAGQTRSSKAKSAQSQSAEEQVLPEEFALEPPYPNPTRGQVTVPLVLPERARVRASVYDVLGRRIQTLAADRSLAAGNETLEFSAAAVPNGVYLIRVNVDAASGGTHTFTEKVTVVR